MKEEINMREHGMNNISSIREQLKGKTHLRHKIRTLEMGHVDQTRIIGGTRWGEATVFALGI